MICIIDNCDNKAEYGNVKDYKKNFCKEHKDREINLINIRYKSLYCKTCLINCDSTKIFRGSFIYENNSKDKYCAKHRDEEMITINNLCIICNEKQPGFGLPTDTKATFCGDCKTEEMIDIIHERCIKCNIKHPVFGLPKDTKANYCGDCKTYDMINIKSFKCIICNIKHPVFGLPKDTKANYCGDCKTEEMIDIISKKCECGESIPVFGLITDNIPQYCKLCKTEDMIDIKNKKCECGKSQPVFGLITDIKANCCKLCKTYDMIDIVNKRCILEHCDKSRYIDKYCARCFYALFPNDKRCIRIKLKENEVVKFIKETFNDLSFIFDETIKGDGLCFNVRPDILLNLKSHSIIIECDEFQHKSYDIICDISRTYKIQEALNRPIVIIRFNPDDYIDKNKRKIKSCFKMDKIIGLTTIPKNQEELWKKRLEELKETIIENIEIYLEEPIKIIKLFYDEL